MNTANHHTDHLFSSGKDHSLNTGFGALNSHCEFPLKEALKKDFAQIPEITSLNFDEFCIAYCEGLLHPEDKKRFSEYLRAHPEKQKDLLLFRQSHFVVDTSIRFPHKKNLKKKIFLRSRHYPYYVVGAAASLALLLTLFYPKTSDYPLQKEWSVTAVQKASPAPPVEYRSQKENTIKWVRPIAKTEMPRHYASADTLPVLIQVSPRLQTFITGEVTHPKLTPQFRQKGPPQELQMSKPANLNAGKEEFFLANLFNNFDLLKTAHTAVAGINYLTESNLALSVTDNPDSNKKEVMISGETFSIYSFWK